MARKWLVRALAVWFLVRGIWYAVDFIWKILFYHGPSSNFQMTTPAGDTQGLIDCGSMIAFAVLMTAWNNLIHFREKGRKLAIFLSALGVLETGFWVALSIAAWSYTAPFVWSYSGKPILKIDTHYFMIFTTTLFLLAVFFLVFLLQKETRMLFNPPPQTAEIPPASDPQPATDH